MVVVGGGGGGGGGHDGARGGGGGGGDGRLSETIKVPIDAVGMIIGKGIYNCVHFTKP